MLALLIACALQTPQTKGPSAWTQGATGPGKRYAHTLLWDDVAKRAVLFGGERNTDGGEAEAILGDLWLYDPAADHWAQVDVKGPKPDDRAYQAAVIDAAGRKLYLHGGFDSGFHFRDDFWVLDLEQHTWTELKPAGDKGDKPSIRDAHSLSFDDKKKCLYLVGGLEDFATMKASKETWVFDLSSSSWKRGPDAPSEIFLHGAIFDPKERCVLSWGGSNAPDQAVRAWNVDKNTWTKLGSGPPAAMAMGSVFDPRARKWYLACCSDGMNANGVVYAWDLDKKKCAKVVSDAHVARGYTAACLDP